MKKAVIFDLDGLLIDSEVISHRLYDELLHRYGKSVTVAEYARDYSGKTGVANMTNVIARYNLPITVEEGLTWEAAREKELLQDVLAALADIRVPIYALNARQVENNCAVVSLTIGINNTEHLNRVVARLSKVKDVLKVTRS